MVATTPRPYGVRITCVHCGAWLATLTHSPVGNVWALVPAKRTGLEPENTKTQTLRCRRCRRSVMRSPLTLAKLVERYDPYAGETIAV